MKVRYLFIAAVVFGVLSIVFLRLNAQHVLDSKEDILLADAQGSDVKPQLEELRQYVFAHMNTSTRIELVGSYNRALEQERQSQGGSLYADAQATCDQQGVSSVAQAQCVQDYLAQRGGATEPTVDKTAFIYTFAAPSWSPDLAGVSLLLAILLALAALALQAIRLFRKPLEPTL